jgi:hypothetical protein
MKRELTLPDIVGYLPYGLYCWYGENIKAALMAGITDYQIPIFEVGRKPILRPMSDLYVEITERGYNDGKPFVPVKRLGELLGSDYEDCLILDCRIKYSPSEVWYSDMCAFLDLLHRLHFDYRGLIDAGLAVSVHDLPTNPYEI